MDTFREFAAEGKYHQLTQSILQSIPSMTAEELSHLYQDIIIPNYYNLHSDSFAEISSSIAERFSPHEALELLENSLFLLMSSVAFDGEDASLTNTTKGIRVAKGGNTSVLRILLDIAHKKILLNEIAEARIILYDCRALQIDNKDSLRRLYLGMGLLHYATKNYSPAFLHLLEFLEISPANEEIFTVCLISGILSEKIYSFTRLISIWDGPETLSLKLAKAIEEGNSQTAVELSASLDKALNETVQNKALTIKLLNYFLSNQQRTVSLIELAHTQAIPLPKLEETVLNILGSGLMKGSIDGITGEFTYTWIGYKYLTKHEISSVGQVISELKQRVIQVQQEVSKAQ